MKKRIVTCILFPFLILFASCAWDDQSTVTITISGNEMVLKTYEQKINYPLIDRFLLLFSGKAYAVWANVRTGLILTVSGNDMDTIVTNIPNGSSSYTLRVPSGTGRKFLIKSTDNAIAYSPVPHPWAGQSIVDLSPGSETSLVVSMMPATRITYAGNNGNGDLGINWDSIAPYNYTGFLEYRIYKSYSIDGPYAYFDKSTPIASNNIVHLGLPLETAYYKIVVVDQSKGEGVYSDPFKYQVP